MPVYKHHVAYAESPHEGMYAAGNLHIVVDENIKIGRLKRWRGQALCTTRTFFRLVRMNVGAWDMPRDRECPKCAEYAQKHGLFDVEE